MSAGHSGYTNTALILRCFHGRAYIAEIYGGCTSAIASPSCGNKQYLERLILGISGLLEILGRTHNRRGMLTLLMINLLPALLFGDAEN